MSVSPQRENLKTSYARGPCDPPLLRLTVGQLLQQAADRFGDRTSAVFSHQDIRKTFHQILCDVIEMISEIKEL